MNDEIVGHDQQRYSLMGIMTFASTNPDLGTIVLPAITLIVTVLIGIATVWVTYAVGLPRKRLLYRVSEAIPASNFPLIASRETEIKYRGEKIENPHIIRIQIINRGRRDIPSSAFDGGEPFGLEFGTPILGIIEAFHVTGRRQIAGSFKASIDESAVRIGPCLIGKRQKFAMALLVEGDRFQLVCRTPLADIDVREVKSLPSFLNSNFMLGIFLISAVAAAAFTILGAACASGINLSGVTIERFTVNGTDLNANNLAAIIAEGTYFLLAAFSGVVAACAAWGGSVLRNISLRPWWAR